MPDPIERPPQIRPQINPETGKVELTPEEWDSLIRWLSLFYDFVNENI